MIHAPARQYLVVHLGVFFLNLKHCYIHTRVRARTPKRETAMLQLRNNHRTTPAQFNIHDANSNIKAYRAEFSSGEIATCVIIFVFLILILVGVIVFGVWTQTMLAHINAEVDNPACRDDNPCTIDFYQYEACLYMPTKNYVPCNNSCLAGGAGMCEVGECTGDCLGNCTQTADCPDVLRYDEVPLDKDCFHGGCIYRNFDPPPLFIPSAGAEGPWGERLCKGCLHRDETLRECFDVLSFYPVIYPDANLAATLCIYAFRCSQYQNELVMMHHQQGDPTPSKKRKK